jgi:phosphotriesterase-related protein
MSEDQAPSPITVQTVTGPIPPVDLGVTLTHEHLLLDSRSSWQDPAPGDAAAQRLATATVSMPWLADLRENPHGCLDNLLVDDVDTAVHEAARAIDAGARTLLDPTNDGCGRAPRKLRDIAQHTGLQVVMGSGFYLERSHPPHVAGMSIEAIAELIETEIRLGVGDTGVRPGLIGEIGLSGAPTEAERRVLRGSARAQVRTGVPLYVHLPGWERLGEVALDVLAEEGCPAQAVVLCHMNPSWDDAEYQDRLARRGAWLGYDMVGNNFFYPDLGAQSPSDDESARGVLRLADAGHLDRILISGDVGQKNMLTTYGGHGYAHVLQRFVPRLKRQGLPASSIRQLLVDNPRELFVQAATAHASKPGRQA